MNYKEDNKNAKALERAANHGIEGIALSPKDFEDRAAFNEAFVAKMDELGFGNCTNTRACEAECPKCISISNIARLNREFISAKFKD